MLLLKKRLRFSFRKHLKLHKKVKKDTFHVVIDGLLDNAIEGALEGEPKDSLIDLRKDSQEASITFECEQHFVDI